MQSYTIRAALRDETNDGWVWMARPSRTLVKITNPHTRRHIFCQVRNIRDQNFLDHYNGDPKGRRITITNEAETIVMGEWYRGALGGFGTNAADDMGGRVQLKVRELRPWGWGSVRAACHHPDIVVRLGTRLGILGAWLGVVGVVPTAFAALGIGGVGSRWAWLAMALLAIILAYGCRGPRLPTLQSK
jgi:hypothetical protein